MERERNDEQDQVQAEWEVKLRAKEEALIAMQSKITALEESLKLSKSAHEEASVRAINAERNLKRRQDDIDWIGNDEQQADAKMLRPPSELAAHVQSVSSEGEKAENKIIEMNIQMAELAAQRDLARAALQNKTQTIETMKRLIEEEKDIRARNLENWELGKDKAVLTPAKDAELSRSCEIGPEETPKVTNSQDLFLERFGRINDMEKRLEEAVRENLQLQAARVKLELKLATKNNEIEDLKLMVDVFEKSQSEILKEKAYFVDKIAELQCEIVELTTTKNKLEVELSEANQGQDGQSVKRRSRLPSVSKLFGKKRRSGSGINSPTGDPGSPTTDIDLGGDKTMRLLEERDALAAKLQGESELHRKAVKEVATLSDELTAARREFKNLKATYIEETEQLKEKAEAARLTQQEIENCLKAQLRELSDQLMAPKPLEEHNPNLTKELEKLKSDFAEKEAQNMKKMFEMARKFRESEKKAEFLASELNEAKTQIGSLESALHDEKHKLETLAMEKPAPKSPHERVNQNVQIEETLSINRLQTDLMSLQTEHDKLTAELSASNINVNQVSEEYEKKLAETQSKNEMLNLSMNALQTEISGLHGIKAEKDKVGQQLSIIQKENETLIQKLESLQQEKENLVILGNKLREEVADLNACLIKKEQEEKDIVSRTKRNVEVNEMTLGEKYDEAQNENLNLQNQITRSSDEITLLQSRLKEMIPKVKEQDDKLAESESRLALESENTTHLGQRLDLLAEEKNKIMQTLKTLVDKYTSSVKSSSPEDKDLQIRLDTEPDKSIKLACILDHYDIQLRLKTSEISALIATKQTLSIKVSSLQKEQKNAEETIASLANERKELRIKLAELESSATRSAESLRSESDSQKFKFFMENTSKLESMLAAARSDLEKKQNLESMLAATRSDLEKKQSRVIELEKKLEKNQKLFDFTNEKLKATESKLLDLSKSDIAPDSEVKEVLDVVGRQLKALDKQVQAAKESRDLDDLEVNQIEIYVAKLESLVDSFQDASNIKTVSLLELSQKGEIRSWEDSSKWFLVDCTKDVQAYDLLCRINLLHLELENAIFSSKVEKTVNEAPADLRITQQSHVETTAVSPSNRVMSLDENIGMSSTRRTGAGDIDGTVIAKLKSVLDVETKKFIKQQFGVNTKPDGNSTSASKIETDISKSSRDPSDGGEQPPIMAQPTAINTSTLTDGQTHLNQPSKSPSVIPSPSMGNSSNNVVYTTRTKFPTPFKGPPPVSITRVKVTGEKPVYNEGFANTESTQAVSPTSPSSFGSNGRQFAGGTSTGSSPVGTDLPGGFENRPRRMSLPGVVVRRKGWGEDGEVEDVEDEPMRKRVGLKLKLRYPIPLDVEHNHDCSGSIMVCRKPVSSGSVPLKWKKRWMFVKDNKVYFLKRPTDREATAIVKLDDCIVNPANYGSQLHSFRISPPPATKGETANEVMWIIAAPSENLKLDWIAAVMRGAAESGKVPMITLHSPDHPDPPDLASLQFIPNSDRPGSPSGGDPPTSPQSIRVHREVSTPETMSSTYSKSSGGIQKILFPFQPPMLSELNSEQSIEAISAHHARFFKDAEPGHRRRASTGSLNKSASRRTSLPSTPSPTLLLDQPKSNGSGSSTEVRRASNGGDSSSSESRSRSNSGKNRRRRSDADALLASFINRPDMVDDSSTRKSRSSSKRERGEKSVVNSSNGNGGNGNGNSGTGTGSNTGNVDVINSIKDTTISGSNSVFATPRGSTTTTTETDNINPQSNNKAISTSTFSIATQSSTTSSIESSGISLDAGSAESIANACGNYFNEMDPMNNSSSSPKLNKNISSSSPKSPFAARGFSAKGRRASDSAVKTSY
ncbi:hypothetical protein HDU76_012108 [Blyttiomyces sp. JEL0837]|nr:hypothetical protein HDU76_012108 [Blyttiomyces sp. JEL0837]